MIAYVFQKYPKNFAILLQFWSNLPVKFAIFLKIVYFLTVSTAFFVDKKIFWAQ